jgi:Fe-S oxidoreductase
LFEMLEGEVVTDGWRSEAVRDALDLCLACKGCKGECPMRVDMATYKAEFLAHHYARRLRPAAHYSMGWLPVLARGASLAPGLLNRLIGVPAVARLAKHAGGIDPQRELPRFAARTFRSSFSADGTPSGGRRVLVWPDTFTNYFHPHVGDAAVEVLQAAGFTPVLPHRTLCCGLTWISTGQLKTARRVLRRTLDALRDELRQGTPVVGLEPSCTAVFRSDLTELFAHDEDAHRLSEQTFTLAELLGRFAPDWQPPHLGARAVVQEHCHHKAILGVDADRELFALAGVDAEILDSGCCGLAGNFGFEEGHYEVSMACAERVLLPAVRSADPETLVVADGFSCRTQVEQALGHRPLHLAEVLQRACRSEEDMSASAQGGA